MTTPTEPDQPGRETAQVTAYGETKTVWAWGSDHRCFITAQALLWRVRNFPRPMTEIDAEAALCLPRRMWTYYRRTGQITAELLDEHGVTLA